MKKIISRGIIFSLAFSLIFSSFGEIASARDLEVSGWIPYWRDSQGIEDAEDNIKYIDTIFPFAYSVTSMGALKDLADLDKRDWKNFRRTAERKDVEVIPTVMWSDGAKIHQTLSNPLTRLLHILFIALMIEEGDYDGVDIDYEGKWADTHDYFALFIKELKGVIGDDRVLSCTIEARTPPESLYHMVPDNIEYANDLETIGKYCDRVQIMAYDQRRADLKLNKERQGEPYMPVADVEWVEKVVEYMLDDIPAKKMVLGVPTYGQNYFLEVAPDWYKTYTRIGALNIPDILDLSDEYNVEPSRNSAGEMSFTYIHKSSPFRFPRNLDIPKNTPEGNEVAAKALAYANKTGNSVTIRYVTYSDAEAIKEKIDVAEDYNLKGVALFKIDGEEDSKIWRYFR